MEFAVCSGLCFYIVLRGIEFMQWCKLAFGAFIYCYDKLGNDYIMN